MKEKKEQIVARRLVAESVGTLIKQVQEAGNKRYSCFMTPRALQCKMYSNPICEVCHGFVSAVRERVVQDIQNRERRSPCGLWEVRVRKVGPFDSWDDLPVTTTYPGLSLEVAKAFTCNPNTYQVKITSALGDSLILNGAAHPEYIG